MIQDVRFALRLIAKERWFSAVIVAALALGIGVNATVFTLLNAVLLRGLPFPDSGRLYMLGWQGESGRSTSISISELRDWRSQSRSFAGLAAFTNNSFNISDDLALPEQARGSRLTANAFGVLRQQPLLGRDFVPDDERRGAQPVVMLGYNLWKNRYGGDPAVLGRSIRVNGAPATIVGVMPQNMQFPSTADIWMPILPTEEQERQRTARYLNVFGRLKDGTSRQEAQTELNGIAGRLRTEYPEAYKSTNRVLIETFNQRFNGGPIRVVFLAMMGAVGFVLLIACANVANLLLSRSSSRAREISVRLAMGATRWRIVRQLLAECLLLAAFGGALGLLLAVAGVRMFDAAVATSGKPFWIVFSFDPLVFGYLASICLLTAILFGTAPALQVSRTNINEVLKEGGRGSAGGARARWTSATMIVVELALTIVLLVGAGLMIRSFLKLYTLDTGIRTDNLAVMRLQLSSAKYANADVRRKFFEQIEPKLAAIPGAESVAITTSLPPFGAERSGFEIEGRPPRASDEPAPQVSLVTVSPRFFETVGVQLRQGRGFRETDGAPGAESILINEQFAAELFRGEDPVGRRIRLVQGAPGPEAAPAPWCTVVGVAPTLRHSPPQDSDPPAAVYVPLRQQPGRGAMLLVRSRVESAAIMRAVRSEVRSLDQDQPVFTIQTVDQMLAQAMWPYRVFGSLFALFAGIGLVLSAVGLYAVMAYSVTQRTQEIGIRMALGAGGGQLSWLFLKRGLVQVAIGLALGLAGAFALSRVIRTLLVQVTPTDPVTFTAITALLTAVALAACLVPARRAMRVDPLIALRGE